jgi:uncharacterized membrane protein
MKIKLFLLVALVSLFPLDALAAAPKLSGPYAFSPSQSCQITLSTFPDQSTGDVAALETINDGKISQGIALATFNKTTVSLSGAQVKGSALLVPGLSGADESMGETPFSGTFNYSIPNASTLILNGIQYHAVYGNIVAGIAKYVTFLVQDPNKPDCVENGTAVHQ